MASVSRCFFHQSRHFPFCQQRSLWSSKHSSKFVDTCQPTLTFPSHVAGIQSSAKTSDGREKRLRLTEVTTVSPLERLRVKNISLNQLNTEDGAPLSAVLSGEEDSKRIQRENGDLLELFGEETGEISDVDNRRSNTSSQLTGHAKKDLTPKWKVGAFQHLPSVSPAYELIGSALKRARMVKPTKGIVNAAKRERNKGAQQLDTLTKELSGPLAIYVRKFPVRGHLHDFEKSLLELTLGDSVYEEALNRVDVLRKKILEVGKNAASTVNKTTTRRDAEEKTLEGFTRVEDLYQRNSHVVDSLKEIAKTLRFMPVVHPRIPTLCLVGAPNVGKSSLVRVLSSGKPEVCNYPFTTRGISMGHFFVDSRRHQVTDTPGLLHRPEEERNNIERLTLAALDHLPVAVLYVHDLTGECGTSLKDQFLLHATLKARFSNRPWLDAISKADLLPNLSFSDIEPNFDGPFEEYKINGPPGAIRVSTETNFGISELVAKVQEMLATNNLLEDEDENDLNNVYSVADEKEERRRQQDEFYFPKLPPEMLRGV